MNPDNTVNYGQKYQLNWRLIGKFQDSRSVDLSTKEQQKPLIMQANNRLLSVPKNTDKTDKKQNQTGDNTPKYQRTPFNNGQ
jgi:hypothetical protein